MSCFSQNCNYWVFANLFLSIFNLQELIYICASLINLIASIYEKYDVKNICFILIFKTDHLIDNGSHICDRLLFFSVILASFVSIVLSVLYKNTARLQV